jgi:hypothetical protein
LEPAKDKAEEEREEEQGEEECHIESSERERIP